MRTKLEKKHIKDCPAMQAVNDGRWDTPWYIPSEAETVYRSRAGNKTRIGCNHTWLVIKCNSVDCNAELLVCEDDILVLLPSC